MANQRLTLVRPANQSLSLERPSLSLSLTRPNEPSAIHCFVKDAVVVGSPPVLTLNALPYARTVAMGSISLSGTATETPTSISWTSSPSGLSGSFTPAANWSGSVSIPAGGVETISITASNAFGVSNTVQVTVGFYVDGAHTWFNAQNVDGQYNSTLVNLDSISTWVNLGSSGLNVTQSTPTSRPTYITSIGTVLQPFVSFDGGDSLINSAGVSNWNFLHQSDTVTVNTVRRLTSTAVATIVNTMPSTASANGSFYYTKTSSMRPTILIRAGSVGVYNFETTTTVPVNSIGMITLSKSYNGTAYVGKFSVNGSIFSINTGSAVSASSTDANGPFNVGAFMVGQLFHVMVYRFELSSIEIQTNKAVDEWALGAAFPVTP